MLQHRLREICKEMSLKVLVVGDSSKLLRGLEGAHQDQPTTMVELWNAPCCTRGIYRLTFRDNLVSLYSMAEEPYDYTSNEVDAVIVTDEREVEALDKPVVRAYSDLYLALVKIHQQLEC